MITQIKPNVTQLSFQAFGSTVYLIKLNNKTSTDSYSSREQSSLLKAKRTQRDFVSHPKGQSPAPKAKRTVIAPAITNILIDTSTKENKQELIQDLKKLNLTPEQINTIITTHNHYDHVGNNSLFKNAKIITNKNTQDLLKELKPIQTPGHTQDSFCILYDDILFSGDTIFHEGGRGRTDLPGGNTQQIFESIEKLKQLNYKILCPGHVD